MAYLALHALGASQESIERFALRYRERLAPLPPVRASLTVTDWHKALWAVAGPSARDGVVKAQPMACMSWRKMPPSWSAATLPMNPARPPN